MVFNADTRDVNSAVDFDAGNQRNFNILPDRKNASPIFPRCAIFFLFFSTILWLRFTGLFFFFVHFLCRVVTTLKTSICQMLGSVDRDLEFRENFSVSRVSRAKLNNLHNIKSHRSRGEANKQTFSSKWCFQREERDNFATICCTRDSRIRESRRRCWDFRRFSRVIAGNVC